MAASTVEEDGYLVPNVADELDMMLLVIIVMDIELLKSKQNAIGISLLLDK